MRPTTTERTTVSGTPSVSGRRRKKATRKCAYHTEWTLEEKRKRCCWACQPLLGQGKAPRKKACANPWPWLRTNPEVLATREGYMEAIKHAPTGDQASPLADTRATPTTSTERSAPAGGGQWPVACLEMLVHSMRSLIGDEGESEDALQRLLDDLKSVYLQQFAARNASIASPGESGLDDNTFGTPVSPIAMPERSPTPHESYDEEEEEEEEEKNDNEEEVDDEGLQEGEEELSDEEAMVPDMDADALAAEEREEEEEGEARRRHEEEEHEEGELLEREGEHEAPVDASPQRKRKSSACRDLTPDRFDVDLLHGPEKRTRREELDTTDRRGDEDDGEEYDFGPLDDEARDDDHSSYSGARQHRDNRYHHHNNNKGYHHRQRPYHHRQHHNYNPHHGRGHIHPVNRNNGRCNFSYYDHHHGGRNRGRFNRAPPRFSGGGSGYQRGYQRNNGNNAHYKRPPHHHHHNNTKYRSE